jgi:hypothetical protein
MHAREGSYLRRRRGGRLAFASRAEIRKYLLMRRLDSDPDKVGISVTRRATNALMAVPVSSRDGPSRIDSLRVGEGGDGVASRESGGEQVIVG